MIDFIIRLLLDYNSINPFSFSLQSKQKEKFSRVHSKVVPIIDSSFQVDQLYEFISVNIDKKRVLVLSALAVIFVHLFFESF